MSARRQEQPNVLCLTLPLPPSSNALYSTVNGRRVLSREGRDYHTTAGWEFVVAAKRTPLRITKQSRFAVTLCMWTRTLGSDIANREKALIDAMSKALAFNDNRIDKLVIERMGVDKENPHVDVTLEVL